MSVHNLNEFHLKFCIVIVVGFMKFCLPDLSDLRQLRLIFALYAVDNDLILGTISISKFSGEIYVLSL